MAYTLSPEKKLWEDHPDLIVNFNSYLICLILCVGLIMYPPTSFAAIPKYADYIFVLPILYSLWISLEVYNTIYELTSQRLRITTGILNRTIDELELYRVIDYKIEQPIYLRVFSLSNIYLETSDTSHPSVFMNAIPNGQKLLDNIRVSVEKIKAERGIREINLNN